MARERERAMWSPGEFAMLFNFKRKQVRNEMYTVIDIRMKVLCLLILLLLRHRHLSIHTRIRCCVYIDMNIYNPCAEGSNAHTPKPQLPDVEIQVQGR